VMLKYRVFVCAEKYECPKGYARCYGSRECELAYFFCDRENDCKSGTDEDPAICSTLQSLERLESILKAKFSFVLVF